MFLRQEPPRADVIIGLGCHDITVADDATLLFKRGIAPLIVFTGNVGRMTLGTASISEAQMMKRRAVTLGVPESAILLEEESTNTGENFTYTQHLLERKGVNAKNAVLVHKPYMLRRDYATFMKQWRGARETDITCWAEGITMEQYLQKDSLDAAETICVMIGDLQRIKMYPTFGYQIEQEIPSKVWRAFNALVERGYNTQLIKESSGTA